MTDAYVGVSGAPRVVPLADLPPTEADRMTVPERFATVVRACPETPAIVTGAETRTYQDLDRLANRIAAHILSGDTTGQQRIALLCDHGALAIAAMLGVLKTGNLYVPLDPAYPEARTASMITDAAATLVFCDSRNWEYATCLVGTAVPIVNLDAVSASLNDTDPGLTFESGTIAYLLYTSGSTGKPKGVIQTHRNLMHFIASYCRGLRIRSEDRLSLFYSLSFSASLMDIYGALLNGATLYPYDLKKRGLSGLPAWLRSEGITVYHSVPTVFRHLLESLRPEDNFATIRALDLGGEPVYRRDVEAFRRHFLPGTVLVNHLGFTEGSVTAQYLIDHETPLPTDSVPVGFPAAGMKVCIQGENGEDLEAEQVGWVTVQSRYLSPGYWQQPDLTAASFTLIEGSDERIYHTGDLGRILADGCIEYLGRKDARVKIRGYNVELAEIEQAILRLGGIKEVAVVAREDEVGERRLVAYLVSGSGPLPTYSALRSSLASILPDYMLPTAVVALDALPLNPNGKVDRRALPAPSSIALPSDGDYVAPRTEMEILIAGIWKQVLGVERVGVHDNFVALGGHSLLLMRIYAALCAALKRSIPLVDLFTCPDVQSLARHLNGGDSGGAGLAQVQERVKRQKRTTGPTLKDSTAAQGIAVVGIAVRFPEARNVAEFWENLKNGVESITHFTDAELVAAGVAAETVHDPHYVKAGTVLDNVDSFDAAFFGMSPREAAITDPQHRLFLECAWEACESAGYDPLAYPNSIGVFAGAGMLRYLYTNLATNRHCWEVDGAQHIMLCNDKDHLATRTSYRLGLRGPSLTVQTACSTSLVATHLACQSLLHYECEMALAGGVSLRIPQRQGYMHQEGGIFAPDGHCRAFDADARGTVFGSGAGVVLLKRLSDAVQDGDTILAVIQGSAINNDGAAKAGFTAPSVPGQVEVIAAAAGIADVAFDSISYVETHGTGTPLGDPIEIEALTRAFRTQTTAKGFCAIGSVKTNIGHLDTAAGIAGLIKTVLALHHRQLPPSLHFHHPNPHIDFANSPFYVNTALVDWHTDGKPRIAGVTSLGVGGTNAHAVLMEAPDAAPGSPGRPWLLFPLSARSAAALEEATAHLARHLRAHPELAAPDVAYTLQVGRRGFGTRRLALCRNIDQAIQRFESRVADNVWTKAEVSQERHVVFMFPGQGVALVNQGREIYEQESVFRDIVDRCAAFLTPFLSHDLRDLFYPTPDREAWAKEQMSRTAGAQPAIFVFEYALAQLWRTWGVEPTAMIGHSVGEYVAACLSGVFTLEDGLRLVAERGRRMQEVPTGGMLAVALSEEEIHPLLLEVPGVSLAAVNSARQCTLSGNPEAIAKMAALLGERGIGYVHLATAHAFHSDMMQEVVAPYRTFVAKVRMRLPQIPFVSNVTGAWATSDQVLTPDYWGSHLREPVRYRTGLEQICSDFPDAVLLEVGPGTVLTRLAGHASGKKYVTVLPSVPGETRSLQSVGEATDTDTPAYREYRTLMEALGRLWLEGVAVNWQSFHAGQKRYRVPLPTYRFQRKQAWIEADTSSVFEGNGFARAEIGCGVPKDEHTAQFRHKDEQTERTSGLRREDIANWFYVPDWKPSLLLPPLEAQTVDSKQILWIVFSHECTLSDLLMARLKRNGGTVVEIRHGAAYQKQDGQQFTISPACPEDYRRVLQESDGEIGPDVRVLHLWSIESSLHPEGHESFETYQALGFYSLLFLAQALQATATPIRRVSISMVTCNLCDVSGNERLQPEKAPLLGSCLVIPQETPDIHCSCIDITLPDTAPQAEWLVDQLLTETERTTHEHLIAYRGKRRWLQDYSPVHIAPQKMHLPSLRPDGVYLITGGTGEIGLALAEHLARSVRAKLILLGRTEFPPRSEWENWLQSHAETDPIHGRITRLIALERISGGILVLSADVGDTKQLQGIMESLYARYGALHGVFHAAGIVRDASSFPLWNEADAAIAERHFRAKVQGVYALEAALRGRTPDFCLLFGSNSAVLGGNGFVAYAAANSFMNAFVADRSQKSDIRWICANWDAWRTASLPISGMPMGLVQDMAITEAEGMAVMERILSDYPTGPIVVSTLDLKPRLDLWVKQQSGAMHSENGANGLDNRLDRADFKTNYVAPVTQTEKILVEIWQECLGIAPIGIRDNFFELGGNSLLATQILVRIRKKIPSQIGIHRIVENPTIEAIALMITQANAAEQDPDVILALLEQILESENDSSDLP